MATYCIGDVQGCYQELQDLLTFISFSPAKDVLWFVGDLVNRGTYSLETLRFIKNLPQKIVVLGNHDFHLLALYCKVAIHSKHSLSETLGAEDADELILWLRQQPLLYHDERLGCVMTHAGMYPWWSLEKAKKLAHEVEQILRGDDFCVLLSQMYGNQPSSWHDDLVGWERLRFIINAFVRMRFCDVQGNLDLVDDGEIGTQPPQYVPWFKISGRKTGGGGIKILFGHWAALDGVTGETDVIALDTGCVWGRRLTAIRLEDARIFSVKYRPESR